MLEIRITNYKGDGTEVTTDWTVDPLKDKKHSLLKRDEGSSTSGIPRRRPYFEQEVRQVTFGAGALISGDSKDNFQRLIRAHKIEFVTAGSGKKKVYTEFVLDAETEIEFEYLEDIIELAFKELKFIEKRPRWFPTWYPK